MKLLGNLAAALAVPLVLVVILLWLIEDWIRGRKIGGY
jgi:hypothetical protein